MPALQEKNKQGDKGGSKQKGSSAKGGRGLFAPHRPGEGVVARRVALTIAALMWIIGGYQLYDFLQSHDAWRVAWGGMSIPLIQLPLNWALLVSVGVFCGGGLVSLVLMNRIDATDFLIDTETEMKKVTWPTKDESVNATTIVIITVAVLGLMMATFDVVLQWVFKLVF